jgi:GT2 family glycosyltransferase
MPEVAVIVATLGRPDVVTETIGHLLATQSLKPAAVIVSCVSLADAGGAANMPGVTVVTGRGGLTMQRNAAMSALPPGADIVVFFDDDFVAYANWLAAAARVFQNEPDVVGLTGCVLADGIKGPGLGFAEAVRLLETAERPAANSPVEPCSPYGCNMAFRLAAVGHLRFDERLVLYGWQEDRDFGATLARGGGRLVKCAEARGVHLGIKRGRVAGERLGYSQIVNPVYLFRKGSMTLGQLADHIFRNFTSNFVLALRPEPFIDRRGRLRGNLRGIADVLCGRVEPERALAVWAKTGE